ncbi:cobalamin binding intrinsic factor-like [Lissotriton helveticus]
MAPVKALLATLLLALGLPGLKSVKSGMNDAQDSQLKSLLQVMLRSWDATVTPNPSILLALRLATYHNLKVEKAMVLKLKEDAVQRIKNNKDFSSGLVALYVLALQASCQNPQQVRALNSKINLVNILKKKYQEELRNIDVNHQPLSNYYQIGLDIIALCLQDVPIKLPADLETSSTDLAHGFSVDTAAVEVLGLTCVVKRKDITAEERKAITQTLRSLVQKILDQYQSNGEIGNIYSTGLAMQALFAAKNYYINSKWNSKKTLAAVLKAIQEGKFNNPMSASQITPSLEGRTYLNAKGLKCSADKDNLPIIPTPATPPVPIPGDITVNYRVIDSLTQAFDTSISVTVPMGSTLLDVMNQAQEIDPGHFSFVTEQTSWGPSIVSINGLAASNSERTYWQLLSGTTPLIQGAGDYKPSNGENLVAKFTNW